MARYKVLASLGQGGMGQVFRALDEKLAREVALKVVQPGIASDPEYRRRFHREVEAAAALAHPGIIKILDFGELPDGSLFYTMELLDAEHVEAHVQKRLPFPARSAADLLEQAADALAFMHARGFVHRDIKPENMMVDRQGRLVVMDFGLVRIDGRSLLTREGGSVGTPRYMAPEAFLGDEVGPPADVYALGLTIWQALAGRRAFTGPAGPALYNWIVRNGPEPIASVRSDCPGWLAALVDRMVTRDPAARPGADAARDVCRSRSSRRPAPSRPAVASPATRSRDPRAAWVGVLLVLLAGLVAWLAVSRPPAAVARRDARDVPVRRLVVWPSDVAVLVDFDNPSRAALDVRITAWPDGRSVREARLEEGETVFHENLSGLEPQTEYRLTVRPRAGSGGLGAYRFRTARPDRSVLARTLARILREDPSSLTSLHRAALVDEVDARVIAAALDALRGPPGRVPQGDDEGIARLMARARSREAADVYAGRLAHPEKNVWAYLRALAAARHPETLALARKLRAWLPPGSAEVDTRIMLDALLELPGEETFRLADELRRQLPSRDSLDAAPRLARLWPGEARALALDCLRGNTVDLGVALAVHLDGPPLVAALRATAERADPVPSHAAMMALALMPDPSGRDALAALALRAPADRTLRIAAAASGVGDRAALLASLAESRPVGERAAAAIALGLLARGRAAPKRDAALPPAPRVEPDPAVVRGLAALVASADARLRDTAVWALRRWPDPDGVAAKLAPAPVAPPEDASPESRTLWLDPIAPVERTGIHLERGESLDVRVTGKWSWGGAPDAARPVDLRVAPSGSAPAMHLIVQVAGRVWNPGRAWTRIVAEEPGEVLLFAHGPACENPPGHDPGSLPSRGVGLARVEIRP